MTSDFSQILLHPVRLRIVIAATGGDMTTAQIASELPDIPQATLYRHVAVLADAGVLEIVAERQMRGAVERTYRVNADRAVLSPDATRSMSEREHLQALATFAGILIETYGRYLASPNPDPVADGVSFRQTRIWLSDAELQAMVDDLRSALSPYLGLGRSDGRSPRLLATVILPDGESRSM